MKTHNRGKFHQYSVCGFQVKNFQNFAYRFRIHEMALFGRFLGPRSPKYGPNLLKLSPEVVLQQKKNTVRKSFEGFEFLWKEDGPKICTLIQL